MRRLHINITRHETKHTQNGKQMENFYREIKIIKESQVINLELKSTKLMV